MSLFCLEGINYDVDLAPDLLALVAQFFHDIVGGLLGFAGGAVHLLDAVDLAVQLVVQVDEFFLGH